MLNSYHKVFVVLDALDEYSNEKSRASLIAALQSLHPNANLLVTSRPNDTIRRLFEGKNQLEISAHDEDVQRYVIGRIDAEYRLSRHIDKRRNLRTEIVETIVQNSKKLRVFHTLPRYLYPNIQTIDSCWPNCTWTLSRQRALAKRSAQLSKSSRTDWTQLTMTDCNASRVRTKMIETWPIEFCHRFSHHEAVICQRTSGCVSH